MYIDIELTELEIENLNRGGFITLLGGRGIRVTVTKDITNTERDDEK